MNLIDKDELLKKLIQIHDQIRETCGNKDRTARGMRKAIKQIEKINTVKLEHTKTGYWKKIMMSEATGWDLSLTGGYDETCEYVCSCCNEAAIVDEFGNDFLPNFCPNCGAEMEK